MKGDPSRLADLTNRPFSLPGIELLHYSKLHQILTQGSPIHGIRLFQRRADAAKWLGISLETLE